MSPSVDESSTRSITSSIVVYLNVRALIPDPLEPHGYIPIDKVLP